MQTIAHLLFGLLFNMHVLQLDSRDTFFMSVLAIFPDIDMDLLQVLPQSPHEKDPDAHAVWTHTLVFVMIIAGAFSIAKYTGKLATRMPHWAIWFLATSHLLLDCVTYSGHCDETSRHIYFWPVWGFSFHLDCLTTWFLPQKVARGVRMMTELGMHMVLWGILLKTLVHNERREENRMHRLNLNRSGELGEHKSVIGAACSADQGQEDIMAKGQPELVIGDPSIADTSIADNGIGLANGVGHARSEGVDNSKTLVLRVVSSSSPPAARDTMLMRCSEENTHSYDENRNDDINYHNQALDNDNYANNASARRDTENVNLEYQYNDVNNDSQGDEGVNGDNDARYRWRRVKGMDALNKLTEPRIILLFIVCNLFQNIYMTYGLYWMMNAHFCFKRKDNYCSSNTISEHTRTATHDGIHNNDPKVRILNCEE